MSDVPSLESGWRPRFRIAAVAGPLMMAMMLFSIIGFAIWPVAAGTTPTAEIFALTQTNTWAAFIALARGVSVSNLISIPAVLAFYASLRTVNPQRALVVRFSRRRW